jgi:2-oxoisovalerate dehydrogenase E1 component
VHCIISYIHKQVKECLDFALASPPPPRELAKQLEYPDAPDTDYNNRLAPSNGAEITGKTVDHTALKVYTAYTYAAVDRLANIC